MKELNQLFDLIFLAIGAMVALYFLAYIVAYAAFKARGKFPVNIETTGNIKQWHINVQPGTPPQAIDLLLNDIEQVIKAREEQGRRK